MAKQVEVTPAASPWAVPTPAPSKRPAAFLPKAFRCSGKELDVPPGSSSPRPGVCLGESREGKRPAQDKGGRNGPRESNQDGAGARCAGGREAGAGCVLSNRKCFISWEWWREARQEEAVIRNIFLTSPTSRPQSARQAAAFGQRGRRAEPPGPGQGRRRPPPGTGDAAAAGGPAGPGRTAGGEQTHEAPPSRGPRHGAELPRLSRARRLRAQDRGRESPAGAGQCHGRPRTQML